MVGVSYLFVRWSQETTQRSKEGRQEGKTLTRRVYYLVQSELSCMRKPQNVYLLFINCWLKDNPGEAWLSLLHSRWGSVARESHTQQITGTWASVWRDLQCWETVGLFHSFSIFYYDLFSCVCDHMHTWMCTYHSTGVENIPQQRCGDQRAAWESYFSSSNRWVLGILLGSSGLAASDLPSERAQQSSLYVFYHYPDNSLQTMWVKMAHIYWERVGFSSPGFMWPTSWCQPAGLLLEASKINLLLSSFKL